jgi:phenylacetate-CoA ligase
LVFNPDLSWEFFAPEQIHSRTIRALRNHVKHALEVSPYYKQALAGVHCDDIQSLEDFAKLPLTNKKTLMDSIGQFRAVTPEQIVETVVTSGSTGRPLVFILTQNDIDRLAFNEALSFHSAGVVPADRAQLLLSLDRLFIAGMAYYRGLTLLGANTCRIGVVPLEMQKHYLELLKPTVIVGVPSFLKKLGGELGVHGFDTRGASIQRIFCIGESIRTKDMKLNGVGAALEEMWSAKVFSTYGNTELSVAYCECTAQCGGHAHPELVYTEIVDEKGNPAPDGTPGELVATPLGVEGMPLVRYRTGDITFKMSEPCTCGRNSPRIGPILARKSQMIKLKGTSLYPLTITEALDELDCIDDYIVLLEGDESLSDQVTIHVVTQPTKVPIIATHLQAKARVSFPVLVTNNATLNMYRGDSRKKMRIIDRRKGGFSA